MAAAALAVLVGHKAEHWLRALLVIHDMQVLIYVLKLNVSRLRLLWGWNIL